MQQIQWQDRFKIGVDSIDQAHHRLFAIVQKIMELYVERHESKFACVEGIKFFQAYALKHFAEEAAYMREIGYPGYQAHKRIHDKMRRETLPSLQRELYDTDFSTQAVQHFIGVCTGWLTGHIMVEDRAITGRAVREANMPRPDDEASVIQALFLQPLQEMFGVPVRFMGELSAGDEIQDAQYYELVYHSQQGPKLRFVLVIGEPLLLRVAGAVFGIVLYSMNEIARFAIQEIAQGLIQRATVCFGAGSDEYHLEQERFLDAEEYRRTVEERIPQYRLLFGVKQDCFALCVDKAPE